jgi:hypothetical protein
MAAGETKTHEKPYLRPGITIPVIKMRKHVLFAGVVLVILLALACPAQAFTAKTLNIAIKSNGDAYVTFDYELSLIEDAAVFLQVADPGTEIQKVLENNYPGRVYLIRTDSGTSRFYIIELATMSVQNGTVTMTTPALSFANAERVLNQFWFAPLINPDFSPDTTMVSFPNGYTETFYNQNALPEITHSF